MFAAGRQIWLGTALAGQKVTLRLDHTSLNVFHDGQPIKTHPVTLTGKDLARLRAADGVLARTLPSPLAPAARGRLHGARLARPAPAPATQVLQVTRVVSAKAA